jgi:hypothetical protein
MKRKREKNPELKSELKKDQRPPLARKRGRPARLAAVPVSTAVAVPAVHSMPSDVERAETPFVPSSPALRPASVVATPLNSSAFFRPFDFSPPGGPDSAIRLPGLTPNLFDRRWAEFPSEAAFPLVPGPQFDRVAPEIDITEREEFYRPSLLSIEAASRSASVSELFPEFGLFPQNSDDETALGSPVLVQTSSGSEDEEGALDFLFSTPSPF